MTLNAEKIHIKWKSGLQILSCLEENDLGMAVGKVNFSEKKKKDWAVESRKEEGSSKGSFQLHIYLWFSIPHPPQRKQK